MGLLWLAPLACLGAEARVAGFEDVALGSPPLVGYTGPGGGGFYNGADGAGGFTSGGVTFPNAYNAEWMSWSGWAYSTTTDVETPGWDNQYSAFAGAAAAGQAYAVTYAPSRLVLPTGWRAPVSVAVTNTTYAGISMRDGDVFARKFGDDPATAEVVETDYPDTFVLTIRGYGADGAELGAVEVYLADFRDAEAAFILDEWREVDLRPLGGEGGERVYEIGFELESTDVGAFGMNTPSYLAVDQLVLEASPTWRGYDLGANGWVDTGDWLGRVFPAAEFLYIERLDRWGFMPAVGGWLYLWK